MSGNNKETTIYISILNELTSYTVLLYLNDEFDQDFTITTLALPSVLAEKANRSEIEIASYDYNPVLYVASTLPQFIEETGKVTTYIYAHHSCTGSLILTTKKLEYFAHGKNKKPQKKHDFICVVF